MKLIFLKELLERLRPAMENPRDSAHDFATEMNKQIIHYFTFVLDPTSEDFRPEYAVATFLR